MKAMLSRVGLNELLDSALHDCLTTNTQSQTGGLPLKLFGFADHGLRENVYRAL
jgi:hypothetical protein